jgi:uncharacterized protein
MMKKINPKTNVLTWFEIPAKDLKRARSFYETVLDIEMETMDMGPSGEEAVFFPRLPKTIMAQSGILSGAIVKKKHLKPSLNGPLIYLNSYPSVQKVLSRVKKAGGSIVQPKVKIPAGNIAVIIDTEGNKVALHSKG